MLLKREDEIIRVLEEQDEHKLIVRCTQKSMPMWISERDLEDYKPCDEAVLGSDIPDYEDLSPAQRRYAHERYTLIAGVLPFLGDKQLRCEVITRIASTQNVSKQTIRHYLYRYLVYQSIAALTPPAKEQKGDLTFDDPIALELMKRTGVNIELMAPTGDPGEKLALMLAGLNYPDIVLMDRSSDIVKQYIEAGALVNLSEYMDLMPNVVAMYGETLNKTRYDDGNNYYLSNWYGYDPDPVNGFICRYDYMVEMVGQERADSAEPFTYSEFVQLLRDWKAKHPQIDGKDTVAVQVPAPGTGSINGVFSGMNGMYPYYVDENNNLALTVYDPLFLDAIHQMNDLYREGLMDLEWTSNSSELLQQKLSQNNVFCVAAAYWDTDVPSRALIAAGYPDGEYLAYKVVADGVDPDKTTLAGRSSLGWDAIGITTNCENIEAACKFIDYCASQEGQDLLLWGIEGQDWEFVNGVRTPIGDIVERWAADSANTINDTGITKWTWFVRNSAHEDDGTTNRIWYNEKNRSNRYAYQNLTNSYYDSAVYSALEPSGSTIEALQYQRCIDLFDTAYPKMVNAASREECDAVHAQLLKDLENAGVEDVQAYMTEQYKARLELWGLE